MKEEWEILERKKKAHGRMSHLRTLEDKILCVVIYHRTYITHRSLGYLLNLHNANICRLMKKIEPILAKKISISKDRSLTPEKIMRILGDVTEQEINRPKYSKKRKKSYSSKKKTNAMKTEIIIEDTGKILSVSKSIGGRVHDFKIRKREKFLPQNSIKYADSGYQGWQKIQANVILPYKRYRKKPLTPEQKNIIKNLPLLE